MPRKRKVKYEAAPVEATVHRKDQRVNIPTAELADFVVKEEQAPYTLRYPRDPSLDPQLVWKGKDQQDGEDLEVPSVPIYIQEHVSPQAIIEDLRMEQIQDAPRQASLFDDFDGMDFGERIDFYRHSQNWTNRMVLGDSLLVMASLAEKDGLKGKVQMIYMDPPYGIKFGSNWQVSTRKRDVRDGRAEDATREPEQIRAFRDTWKLVIHSYLSYWRDRLVVARDLLTETGSVIVQIGDQNVHLVRGVLDEVFGAENFMTQITYRTSAPLGSKFVPVINDYLLWYAKDRASVKFRRVFSPKTIKDDAFYDRVELGDGTIRRMSQEEQLGFRKIPEGAKPFSNITLVAAGPNESTVYPIDFQGKKWLPTGGRGWKMTREGAKRLGINNRLYAGGSVLRYKVYLQDFQFKELTNVWMDLGGASDKVYVVQTNSKVIQRCMLMTTDPGDLVLDPTCGSGTTAYVAEQWGRRWITIDTSRVAIALARTRLMSGRFPYYILADTPEGIIREAEVAGQPPPSPLPPTEGDIKKGFVYRPVPHITLKSIANNPDIKEGMTREEMDAAIARHSESETLYDQPQEDRKVVRVTGPLTVESLSPHRVLATGDERPRSEEEATDGVGAGGQFEAMILENLRKAGVQQYDKQERIKFSRLEPYAGLYIHGEGEYDENGQTRRVAISIGPEHGTVGTELVKEAAKEAVRGVGFDLLIVTGFAFDPHVGEEAKRYGKLTVVTAKINPDLQMGDEFLKKTGSGNLFMVFGEPDIEIEKHEDGKVSVEIKGVDVYDPTTGEIRNHTTDDIACWFIDTDYSEESFFVRHAYFCGGDEPYDRLKRALKAEIDEDAWSTLYSTASRPFDPPETGKIAVKVINHYGDEVLKVYEV